VTSAILDRAPVERVRNQTAKAVQLLRDMILGGRLAPGERLSETDMVELLGVSRTLARMAMMRLYDEGLVEEIASSGGFRVRSFSADEVFAAVAIRGLLESLAARLAAERRPAARDLDALRVCVAEMDDVVQQWTPSPRRIAEYAALNDRFHTLLGNFARSPNLTRQLDRASALPFASPSSLLLAQSKLADLSTMLVVAQDQHRCILDAIKERDGTRAEAITREHNRLAARLLDRILQNQEALSLVPGHTLITGTNAKPVLAKN
jgi:GntR family transcriptional regulator, vanillate catabolism transcriptional regulator